MKKKKLRLNELKVKSFVTQNEELNRKTVKGGRNIIDLPADTVIDPIGTKVVCGPTPGTWCYHCPADF